VLTILILACTLIWLPILHYQLDRHGLVVLIVWIFLAPIVSNLIRDPTSNPFFPSPTIQKVESSLRGKNQYLTGPTTIHLHELLEPTRILIIASLAVFLVKAVLKKRQLIRLDRTEICMGIFAVLLVISVLWQSKRTAFGLRMASDAFIIPFFAYYLTRRYVRTEQHLRKLIRIIGFMGVYLIPLCLIDRLVHGELFYRISGPFPTGNTLHTVMAAVFFMVLLDTLHGASAPEERQALPRGIQWLVLCLAPVTILLTLSRGNWAGLLLGMWVLLFLGRQLVSFSRKVGVVGFALMFAWLVIIALPLLIPGEFMERRVGNLPNIYGRFATWSAAIQEGIKDPIFGIGLNNLRNFLAESTARFGDERSYSTVHNSFLAIFTELGVIGLITYMGIAVSIIRKGFNLYRTGLHARDRWRGVALIALMAAYLTPALFANTIYTLTPLHHLYTYVFAGAVAGLDSWRRSTPILQVPLEQPTLVNPKARAFA
jgi:putative inorganic carbon (HCO3(-)) transporter